MAKTKTSYSKDNPAPNTTEQKRRGKGKRVLMLDAIRDTCEGGESEYLKKVIEASLGDPLAEPPIPPNPQLMNLVMNRIEPPLKGVMPVVEFDFTKSATPAKQASQILYAASKGIIPPDVAGMFISSVASMLKIDEITMIKAKLEEFEKIIGGANE